MSEIVDIQLKLPEDIGGENACFTWVCPDCGGMYYGQLADDPVSGWDEPRWTVEGEAGRESLHPSLGCRYCMRESDGSGGHFWYKNGKAIRA